MAITFVYRSHYEGVLSKYVKRFADATVLAWFERVWPLVTQAGDIREALEHELGVSVYGLATLFEAAHEHGLDAPDTALALRALVEEHLYVEGEVIVDDHTFRAHTDDDEVRLAYFFFDETAPAARVAYLLHDTFPLPGESADEAFESPVATTPALPAGRGPGRTWAVLLTFYDSDSFPSGPTVFDGVRVPALLQHLRDTQPVATGSGDYPTTWPYELLLLRAAIRDGDEDLGPALARVAQFPYWTVANEAGIGKAGLGPQRDAWAAFESRAARHTLPTDKPSLTDVSPHLLQLAAYQSTVFGYQQWFLFDDLWAAAHRDLATSLLRYAASWDPFEE